MVKKVSEMTNQELHARIDEEDKKIIKLCRWGHLNKRCTAALNELGRRLRINK